MSVFLSHGSSADCCDSDVRGSELGAPLLCHLSRTPGRLLKGSAQHQEPASSPQSPLWESFSLVLSPDVLAQKLPHAEALRQALQPRVPSVKRLDGHLSSASRSMACGTPPMGSLVWKRSLGLRVVVHLSGKKDISEQ